jgi:hypothetical protein
MKVSDGGTTKKRLSFSLYDTVYIALKVNIILSKGFIAQETGK